MILLFYNFKDLLRQQHHVILRGKALKMRQDFLQDFKNQFLKNQ